jgi:hypothetical protein
LATGATALIGLGGAAYSLDHGPEIQIDAMGDKQVHIFGV